MNRFYKKYFSIILAIAIFFSSCPDALATNRPHVCPQTTENCVTFANLSNLAIGESIQGTHTACDGTKVTVGIEKIPTYTRAGEETWRVWFKSIGMDVEFYMTVSNNKVKSVYDYSILLVGASYENPDLTKTSTYGKLTFTYKVPMGLAASTCWLKGTVTGSDDKIEVSWKM